MCDPITMSILIGGSTGLSVYSSIEQGKQQEKWSNYQADQAQADARAERSAAEVRADKLRKMAKAQAGQATAALAASGVDVGEGTALNINKQIYADAEQDAIMEIFGGNNQADRLNAQSVADRMKGKQAMNAGYINAGSSVLGSAASYGQWNTSMKAAKAPKVSA